MSGPFRRLAAGAALATIISLAGAVLPVAASARASTSVTTKARNLVGSSVAISGNTAVIGAPGVNQDTGVVYIYQRSGTKWRRSATLTDPRNAQLDNFGSTVAIWIDKTTTYIVVGIPKGNVAFVYTGSGATWHLRQTLQDPGTSSDDSFSSALAISANLLVVGSPDSGFDAGGVYIYRLSGSRWVKQAALADPAQQPLDLFGRSLAVVGANSVLISAVDVVYAYTRNSAQAWSQTAVIANPGLSKDNFGSALSASGSTAVIGAPGDVPGPFYTWPGAAYIFTVSGTTWSQQQELPVPGKGSFFGWSTALTGSRMLIGMPWYGTVQCGAVFEYTFASSTWQRQDRLRVRSCKGGDQFGDEVALDGTTALIGAPFEGVDQGAFYFRTVP